MDYIYIAAGVSLLLVIYYYYLTKNFTYWEKKCIPYLKNTLPGIGNLYPLFSMRQNTFQMYEDFYKKMPGCSVVGFYHGTDPALLIRDPELVKSVLQTNFSSFSDNGRNINLETDGLFSRSPLFLQGKPWKSSRQQLSSAFTSGKLKYMYESIDTVCEKFVKYLNNKIEKGNGEVEVEFKELYSRYTAEVIASAAFGIEGNSFKDEEDSTIVEIGRTMFEPSFATGVKQIVAFFFPLIAKVFHAGLIPPQVDKIFRTMIKDILKYREDNNLIRPDFMQSMMSLKKTGSSDHLADEEFDDSTITSHSFSLFVEGHETSSLTLSFIGYHLAIHPEIQQRVRDEVLMLVKKHNGITYDALQEMTYMDKVINESMRVYPPVGVMFKVCTNEIELKGSDGITCRLMPGAPVMISFSGLHNDSKYWTNPEKFDPERFSEENKNSRHRFTYNSFGEGPRVCIGMRMAILQMKAAIATTIQNYTLELSPKTQLPLKISPYYFMPAAVGGLWAKLKPL